MYKSRRFRRLRKFWPVRSWISQIFFTVFSSSHRFHRCTPIFDLFLTYSVISETGGCLWVLMGANPPGVQADLQSAFKKCPDLFGICGFAIRSRQECCCWIRAHSPSSFFEKRRNLYIFGFLGSRGRSWYGFSENGREKRKKQNLPPKSQNLPVALQQSYTLNIGSRHMNREKMHLIPNNFCIFAVRIRYLFICQ